jgi:hypothetical protein
LARPRAGRDRRRAAARRGIISVSEVEVSLSTVMQLKVRSVSRPPSPAAPSAAIAASVKM